MFTDAVSDDKEFNFKAGINGNNYDFSLHAFLLPKSFSDDEKGNNAIYYGAHNRTVERYEMDQAIGLKTIEGNKVYFGFAESNYLDEIVNSERTHLAWPVDLFDEVHRKAIDCTKEFLGNYIEI